jgi:hypothetical protein
MALPENRLQHANLTPEEMRQGIKRLEIRRAEVEQYNFGIESGIIENFEHLRGAAEDLHKRVVSALARCSVIPLRTVNMWTTRLAVGVYQTTTPIILWRKYRGIIAPDCCICLIKLFCS